MSAIYPANSGGEIVQDHRTEQLYDQLIQLFLARTTEVLAVYINPVSRRGHPGPTPPASREPIMS